MAFLLGEHKTMEVEGQVANVGSAAADAAPIAGADLNLGGGDESWANVDEFTPDPAGASEASVTTADAAAGGDAVIPKPDATTDGKAVEDKTLEAKPAADAAADESGKAPAKDAVELKTAAEGDQAALDAAALNADPELSPAENALVQTLPKAEQPAAIERFKRAPFMDHFLGTTPAEQVRAHLEKRSASRYGELEQAIIGSRLSDPRTFASQLFQKDPILFGKLADAVYNGDPKFFAGAIAMRKNEAGRYEADPQYVQKAVDFYDKNKDRISDDDPESLTAEQLESIEELHPDLAPIIKSLVEKAGDKGKLDPSVQQRLDKLREFEEAEQRKSAAGQTDLQRQAAEEVDTLYDEAYSTVEDFVAQKLDDAVDGLGLKVTDAERAAAPDVANLKDLKRGILLKGFGDLPGFEDGLGKWGEPQPKFMEIGKALGRFTAAREKDNAISHARMLFPFADTYLSERLNHPMVKWLDAQILAATGRAGAKAPGETFVPGAAAAPSGGKKSSWDNVDDFEPQR